MSIATETAPEQQAGASPCGSTPCWSPTPITFTTSVAGLKVTATPGFTGNVTWNWGDGQTTKSKRGVQSHTYAAAGTYQVVGSPLHSACSASSAQVPVTVA